MDALRLTAWVAGAYLVGSIPFGLLVGKGFFGVDIREHGSKNLGATNAARVLGGGRRTATIVFFLAVFALDAAKGFVPAFLASRLEGDFFGVTAGLFTGFASVAGHMASIYLKFKGGKGVAVSTGMLAALVPWPLAVAALAWGLCVAVTRKVSVGSLCAAVVLPVAVAALGFEPALVAACSLLAIAVIVKHRGNIVRLLQGTENRIGGKSGSEACSPARSSPGEEPAPVTVSYTHLTLPTILRV